MKFSNNVTVKLKLFFPPFLTFSDMTLHLLLSFLYTSSPFSGGLQVQLRIFCQQIRLFLTYFSKFLSSKIFMYFDLWLMLVWDASITKSGFWLSSWGFMTGEKKSPVYAFFNAGWPAVREKSKNPCQYLCHYPCQYRCQYHCQPLINMKVNELREKPHTRHFSRLCSRPQTLFLSVHKCYDSWRLVWEDVFTRM